MDYFSCSSLFFLLFINELPGVPEYAKMQFHTMTSLKRNVPLAAEGAMCTFILLRKNAYKDLQPPEKSGLQYKCLVMILKTVYECIVSNGIYLKQFTLEIKSSFLFGDNSYYRMANAQFFGVKRCHMSHSTFCNQRNLGHVLIEKVLYDKCHLLSRLSYILSLKKKVLSVKWYLLSPNNVLL